MCAVCLTGGGACVCCVPALDRTTSAAVARGLTNVMSRATMSSAAAERTHAAGNAPRRTTDMICNYPGTPTKFNTGCFVTAIISLLHVTIVLVSLRHARLEA